MLCRTYRLLFLEGIKELTFFTVNLTDSCLRANIIVKFEYVCNKSSRPDIAGPRFFINPYVISF